MRMAVACHAALAKARGTIVNVASMHAIFARAVACVCRVEGGHRITHQVVSRRLGRRRHSRQRDCAGLDRDAHDRARPLGYRA